jgi:hypothetical protein
METTEQTRKKQWNTIVKVNKGGFYGHQFPYAYVACDTKAGMPFYKKKVENHYNYGKLFLQ